MRKTYERKFGTTCKTINLIKYFNWPPKKIKGDCWQKLLEFILKYPEGNQKSWGIPFQMGRRHHHQVIVATKSYPEITIKLVEYKSKTSEEKYGRYEWGYANDVT